MRRILPLLVFLPGCTFFTSSNGGPVPRSAAELKDVSPALYIVIGLFCLILVACVGAMLFKKSVPDASGRLPEDKMLAFFLAALSTVVILLLVG